MKNNDDKTIKFVVSDILGTISLQNYEKRKNKTIEENKIKFKWKSNRGKCIKKEHSEEPLKFNCKMVNAQICQPK